VAVSIAPTVLGSAARIAAAVGRAAARHVWNHLRHQIGGAAVSDLKLWLAVLLSGLGLTMVAIVLPVVAVVFMVSTGVSHGMRLDLPAPELPAGPPLGPGQLACPLPGSVLTQPFGPSDLAGEPAMFGYSHFHTGIDLAAPEGTPIHAAEAGQVLQAAGQTNSVGFLVGYGNLVRLAAAGGRVEYYGHMSRFAVGRGDPVQQYQVIGYVGSTGYSTGPHVHFEMRVGGTPVDPAPSMAPC
jgi:murein DD-endopeptidase MepM/ murein hydrolase activator NlpD